MMDKPTQSDIDTTHDFLEWYRNYLQENEPYAMVEIRNIDAVLETLPYEVSELEAK